MKMLNNLLIFRVGGRWLAGLVLCCLPLASLTAPAVKPVIGVVEFEVKTPLPGLPDAGQIVAEWVNTEITRIGKFQIAERLLLGKV